MTEERKQELEREWDLSDQMDDDEYQEWYDGLTGEEQGMIDAWDKQYRQGVQRICEEMLEMGSRKPTLDDQIEAAAAVQKSFGKINESKLER